MGEVHSTDLWFRSDMVLPGQTVVVYQRKRCLVGKVGWSQKCQVRDEADSRMETGLTAEGKSIEKKLFLPILERVSLAGWI